MPSSTKSAIALGHASAAGSAGGAADGAAAGAAAGSEAGGAAPAILNAANEIAVAAFLGKRIGFLEIAAIVEDILHRYDPAPPETLDAVIAVDARARELAVERVEDCIV